MPTFIDHHARSGHMPPEAAAQAKKMLEQLKAGIKAKKADQFGVRTINVFMGANGDSWCLTEAPDAHAVIRSHAANGARLTHDDVEEVTPLV